MKKSIILALCSCAMMVACNKSDEATVSTPLSLGDEVRFGMVATRATAVTDFVADDNIYIASKEATVNKVGGEKIYTVDGQKNVASTSPLYWDADVMSFYATNQQLTASDNKLIYDIKSAEKELLWLSMADKSRGDNSTNALNLAFKRVLSQAELNITFSGLYATVAPEDIKFYLKSATAMSFDPWSTTFTATPEAKPADDNYATSWSCAGNWENGKHTMMLIPQTLNAKNDLKLVVTDSGVETALNITADDAREITFEPGKVTKVNITLSKAANEVSVGLSGVTVEEFAEAEMSDDDKLIIPNHN